MENIRRPPTTSVDLHVAEVIISFSPTEFSFSPFSVGLPLPFHPSGICAGGIKVALLSSKLQISFASVHLTLCFITVARGSARFPSALRRVITPTDRHSPLPLTLLLLHFVGRGIIFMEFALIGPRGEDWQHSEQPQGVTCVTSRHQTDKVVIVVFAQADPEHIAQPPLTAPHQPLLVFFSCFSHCFCASFFF